MRTVFHNVDWQNGDNLSKAATMSTTQGERKTTAITDEPQKR